jgi:HD superfamily phosphohydrolase YqeK
MDPLHPLVEAAAAGALPEWADASDRRREHMSRVATLMDEWAAGLDLSAHDRTRWRALGYLHDMLRDAPIDELRDRVPPGLRDLSGQILHGPAAAERLRIDGVLDGELLRAVAYHTAGHPSLGAMGRALYVADFLDPGRRFLPEWRAGLRDRMPGALDTVTREVVGARIRNLVEHGSDVLEDTFRFWNSLVMIG